MRLKQYFIEAAIRTSAFFLLFPIVESIIISIRLWYEETNVTVSEVFTAAINNSLFLYGGYFFDNKVYLLKTVLIIFGITFVLSVLSRKLLIYDNPIFSKKMLLYVVIVLLGVLLFKATFSLNEVYLSFFVIEVFTTILMIFFHKGYFKRIRTSFVQFLKMDIWK